MTERRRRHEREVGQEFPEHEKELVESLGEKYSPIPTDKIEGHRVNSKNHIMGNGFLRRGWGTILIGGTGVGKSVMALQMAVCVAAGKDFLGRMKVHRPARVLLINSQNDIEILKIYTEGIYRHTGIGEKDVRENLDIRFIPGLPQEEFFLFLEYLLKETRPGLLIVDPFQDFIGAVDINAYAPFFEWRNKMDNLLQAFKVALLTTPHTTKPREREGWMDEEMVYLAAGAAAIANWCRAACALLHEKADPAKYRLQFSKNPIRTGIVNEVGETVKSLYIEHASTENDPCWKLSKQQMGALKVNEEAVVKDAAWSNPSWSYRELAQALGMSKTTVVKHYPEKLKEIKKERS